MIFDSCTKTKKILYKKIKFTLLGVKCEHTAIKFISMNNVNPFFVL